MFKSIVGIFEDAAKIVAAPVSIAADVTRAVTKPLAQGAEEVAKVVKDLIGTNDRSR